MKVVLKNVRLAFPSLFKPESFDGGEERYSAVFLVEPNSENDKVLRSAINAAAKETWGEKAVATLKAVSSNANKFCYRDGAEKAHKYEGFEGAWALSGHRKATAGAPKVVNRDLSPVASDSGTIYAGCYVNVSVDIWAQKAPYEGVRCTLIGVQFSKEGDAFGGAPATADDFEALDGAADDDFSAFAGDSNNF